MCYKIGSPFVLMHLLRAKESCTVKEMVAVKRKIEEEVEDVYVDASKSSILETVSSYPEIFNWEENHIRRNDSADNYFQPDVMDFFGNTGMDKSLESKIVQCIKDNG
jgi:hypothetical protein